jgi:hypothetical protein
MNFKNKLNKTTIKDSPFSKKSNIGKIFLTLIIYLIITKVTLFYYKFMLSLDII